LNDALRIANARQPISALDTSSSSSSLSTADIAAASTAVDSTATQSRGVLPVVFYNQLSAVENELAAEKRVSSELEREAKTLRRLLAAREHELLTMHGRVEAANDVTPAIAASQQQLANMTARADELTDENRTLLAVNRAKTRTIEKLTQQLTEASEIVVASRTLYGELQTTKEALRVSVARHFSVSQLQTNSNIRGTLYLISCRKSNAHSSVRSWRVRSS
jgi:galactitol-specific phosphotransferase system IIB component